MKTIVYPCCWLLCLSLAPFTDYAAAEVTAAPREDRVIIRAGGQPFTEYLTRSERQPILWPVFGPTGKAVTRGYPMQEQGEDERADHPHHRSIWFTHGDVNGADFWHAPECIIAHRDFERVENLGDRAIVVARNDWLNRGEKVCSDRREYIFAADGQRRWIDCDIVVTAAQPSVTFGDTKEGSFAVRVAGSMKVTAEQGGRIVNSNGQVDADAWGQPAEWVDYTGPVDGETVGIAIFSHPDSFRHPCRWHVRTYGLFAANPFGESDFPDSEHISQGAVELKQGESLRLRYRILLHRGTTEDAKIADAYADYVGRDKK